MVAPELLVLFILVSASVCAEELVFPTTLKFGVATSSYQVEGAWNVSDKGLHIWDNHVHIPGKVVDGSTGDVACDSYHKWQRDIEMLEELGADFYRFSISWPRILPSGFPNHISEDGKNYYNKLIDGLLKKGIQPLVTIYHWELPQQLQDLGGWTNPLITDWFADYARVLFSLFGDRVKTWITINEPIAICEGSYTFGMLAPGIISPDNVGTYLCNKHVLMAHAKAWRIYDQEFRSKYQGEVSYCNNIMWYEETTPKDVKLAELSRQLNAGRYSHPVYSKAGGWPPAVEKIIAENSARQGYHGSRLPPFTPEEIKLVRGTYDFYGFNYYTTRYVSPRVNNTMVHFPFTGSEEIGATYATDPSWKVACNGWLAVYPPGLRKHMAWLRKEYGDLKFLLTENGYPTCEKNDLGLEDQEREDYYREHLEELQKAMSLDGVNVAAFTFWSLMDNFEWMDGYDDRDRRDVPSEARIMHGQITQIELAPKTKFGLYAVNFTDPERTRTPRKSARYFSKIVQSRKYVPATEPVKYKTDLYMWYSFVAVLICIVIVLLLFIYVTKSRRNKKEEKTAENIIPLVEDKEAGK